MSNTSQAHAHEHEHHIVPTRVYLLTLLALVILMLATIWAATITMPGIGPLSGTVVNQVVALIIAVAKALLVITFFMGVKYGTKLIKLWAAAGFVWFTLLFLILGDYTTRHFEMAQGWEPKPDGSLPRATPEEPVAPGATSPDLNVKIRQ